jgi:hypothetical protein
MVADIEMRSLAVRKQLPPLAASQYVALTAMAPKKRPSQRLRSSAHLIARVEVPLVEQGGVELRGTADVALRCSRGQSSPWSERLLIEPERATDTLTTR